MGFEELKARTAAIWSSAPWEEAEHMLAPVHDRLAAALDPQAGDRWLDVGCGTGAVALRAARAGADVTGLDIAPTLVETARRRASEEGLAIRFDVGDAEALPYEDASFDKVSSSMGVIFAPTHAAAASELARVLPSGGRLGFTAWRPGTAFFDLTRKYAPPPPEGVGNPDDWGSEDYVGQLLGDSFELTFEKGLMEFEAESGDEAWERMSRTVGPFKAANTGLEPERLAEFRRHFVELFEAHRTPEGVRLPADYLLVLGTRR